MIQLEIHIGYVYGMDKAPDHASHYSPKFLPGARIPHAWIRIKGVTTLLPVDVSYVKEFSEQDTKSRQYSTLDLCIYDHFTLLVGSRGQWVERFQALRAAVKGHGVRVALAVAHHDFEFVLEQQEQLFAREGRLGVGGGLLIRPDQHVLCLIQPTDSATSIAQSLAEHLGLTHEADLS